jgi:hypothetical protein
MIKTRARRGLAENGFFIYPVMIYVEQLIRFIVYCQVASPLYVSSSQAATAELLSSQGLSSFVHGMQSMTSTCHLINTRSYFPTTSKYCGSTARLLEISSSLAANKQRSPEL